MHILGKQTYAPPDGSWHPTSSEEIRKFVAFLLYMGLVRVGSYELYWSTASLYYGLWGRAVFTRLRFKALLAFLHMDAPDNDPADRLHKVRFVYDKVRTASAQLWQLKQHVSLDERMIRFKGRHSSRALKIIGPTSALQTLHARRTVAAATYMYKLKFSELAPRLRCLLPPPMLPPDTLRTRRQVSRTRRHPHQLTNPLS